MIGDNMAKYDLQDLNNETEINDLEDLASKNNKIKRFFKELIPYVIILVVVIIIRTFFITPIVVNGPSMQPTLDGGEIMLLNKRAKFDRFDVVVIDIEAENIIKRIVALPGETISCKDGVIYVNDRRQDEDYSQGVTPDFDKVKLADDEYFVLGDNRENSLDSQELGPFKKSQIKGVSEFVLFPFGKFGKI